MDHKHLSAAVLRFVTAGFVARASLRLGCLWLARGDLGSCWCLLAQFSRCDPDDSRSGYPVGLRSGWVLVMGTVLCDQDGEGAKECHSGMGCGPLFEDIERERDFGSPVDMLLGASGHGGLAPRGCGPRPVYAAPGFFWRRATGGAIVEPPANFSDLSRSFATFAASYTQGQAELRRLVRESAEGVKEIRTLSKEIETKVDEAATIANSALSLLLEQAGVSLAEGDVDTPAAAPPPVETRTVECQTDALSGIPKLETLLRTKLLPKPRENTQVLVKHIRCTQASQRNAPHRADSHARHRWRRGAGQATM